MKNEQKEIIQLLKKYNQHHIVEHMEKLNDEDKAKLIEQIKEINFEEIINLYNKANTKREKKKYEIKPMKTIISKEIEETDKQEYIKIGENILAENKYAVVTMAGGQGTRLRTQWTKRNF